MVSRKGAKAQSLGLHHAAVCLPPGWPVDSDWTSLLAPSFQSDDFQKLWSFVDQQRMQHPVYPAVDEVFNAFRATNFNDVKVVILGQDPYHGEGQAHGLSFSVPNGCKLPPSLKNIFKELATDVPAPEPSTGCLQSWADQGVFLLNTVLTVRQGEANSHRKQGWETFTDEVIRQLNARPQPVVFILWGKPAQLRQRLIDDRHTVITSPHPSPLSSYRGFFGSRPFSRANEALCRLEQSPIAW